MTEDHRLDASEFDHWVQELFPVTYKLQNEELQLNEDADPPKQSIFEQLARRVSPLDEAALRNVYEKVWLMLHLEKEEKNKREKKEKEEERKQALEGRKNY